MCVDGLGDSRPGGARARSAPGGDEGRAADGPSRLTVRWEVVGRVQGVGFRWFVREQARRWGLAGWVRNLPDGSVEVAAMGAEASVNGLLAAVRRGPPGAIVQDVRIVPDPGDSAAYPEPFSILRG